jgi:hypothetical protein
VTEGSADADANFWGMRKSGTSRHNSGNGSNSSVAWAQGDVISLLLDVDAGTLTSWVNGTDAAILFDTTLPAGEYFITFATVDNGSGSAMTANFGASAFAYTMPEGYSAWTDGAAEPATGSPSLSQMTAFGYEPGGAPSLAAMNASASTPPVPATGDALLQVMTALASGNSAGELVMAAMVADATGGLLADTGVGAGELAALTAAATSAGTSADGALVLEPLAAAATTPLYQNSVGAPRLRALLASGLGPFVSAPSLEEMTATGVALNGRVGAGSAVLRALVAQGVAQGEGLANGTAVLRSAIATGTGIGLVEISGAPTLRAMRASGLSLGGQAAAGELVLARMTAAGVAEVTMPATGADQLPRMRAYGVAEAANDGTLRTWVMNTRTSAVSRYPSYPANSFARYNGTYLSAGPSGLYTTQGPTSSDDGTDVVWGLRTGAMDDKRPNLKRLTELLFGVRYDYPIRVTVWKDEETEYEYALGSYNPGNLHQARVKPGKGLRSRYFKVGLSGKGRLELDSLQATMPDTTRRIG